MGGAKKNPGANLQAPNWDRVQLRPFKKEFYVPHPTIERRYIHFKILNTFVSIQFINLYAYIYFLDLMKKLTNIVQVRILP